MCSPRGNTHIVAALAMCLLLAGCARPAGVLFPPLDSPLVWPRSPERPRIEYVGILSDSDDLNAARSGAEAFAAGFRGPRPPIRFSGPHALAIRSDTVLAVADGSAGGVHIIDIETRTHRFVSGWLDDRFSVPVGVTWVGKRLFVTDAQRGEVVELDSEGAFQRRFGVDALTRPVGITYVPDRNQLYVVDGGSHRLAVFDLRGEFVRTIGRRGSDPGEFNFPSHISHGGKRLLVADSANFRVQLLDLDGRCVQTIGQKGDGAGDFSLPKGVAFDSEGHVYVVDAQFENIQVFSANGQLLMAWGDEGSGVGQFVLPAGLAIDGQDRIWVADAGNRQIQVFAYLGAAS